MGLQDELGRYVEMLSEALGHADRKQPFAGYCTGLMLSGKRKSIEPMAARVSPFRASAAHQSLHHFVTQAGLERCETVVAGARVRAAQNATP